jgi:predicted TIM-barrel fold metal-dependent hydrolase
VSPLTPMRVRAASLTILASAVLSFAGRAAAAPTPTAVDTHAHVFQHDLKLADVRRYAPDYDATCDDYLRHLDANGVSHGVLIQPSFLGTDNGFMLACVRKHPDRLRAIAVVEPGVDEATLRDLADAGVVGIRLNLVGKPLPDLASAPWQALLASVARLGWHVQVHREARDLPRLIGPLLDAGLRVVVDHFGRYDPKLGTEDPGFRQLLATAQTRKVWVKLSGAYRNGSGEEGEATAKKAAHLLLEAFGPDRLVWGSDWPHTQFDKAVRYEQTREALDAWVPEPAQRRRILVDTPRQLYGF